MNALGRLVSGVSSMFEFNKATLSGALDVIVVENSEGEMTCNPFRVRFGKLKVLKSSSCCITLTVNGSMTSIVMKLTPSGEGYFPSPGDSSPLHEENKCVTEELSANSIDIPHFPACISSVDSFHNKPERILPKNGDFCDDLICGDEEIHEESSDEHEMTVEMSLCGDIWDQQHEKDQEKLFSSKKVAFEEFQQSPWEIMNHPSLLVRMDNTVYTKEQALPMIMSLIIFKKPLSATSKDYSKIEPAAELRTKVFSCFTLNSEQLKSLDLKEGRNDVVYTVTSSLQGVQQVHGRIFLWKSDSKIVISDVDGTITKSDVLGHLLTMMGKDWSHIGVARLYDLISKNGYKIVYLSSRAIGQANLTRDFLFSLRQDGVQLPDGPLIVSPDRLFKSFFREVIEKSSQKFKASALNEIARLFPVEYSPFYAGFGNRDTDAIAYRTSGVALDKIFIINPKGSIFVFNHNVYLDSYPQMIEIVHEIFPPINL